MDTTHAPTRALSAARPQTTDATPIRIRALSIAIDCCQIRLDNATPGGWLYRRLLFQRSCLEKLALVPRLGADGRRV